MHKIFPIAPGYNKSPLDRNFSNIYETRPIIFGNIMLTITFVKTPIKGRV